MTMQPAYTHQTIPPRIRVGGKLSHTLMVHPQNQDTQTADIEGITYSVIERPIDRSVALSVQRHPRDIQSNPNGMRLPSSNAYPNSGQVSVWMFSFGCLLRMARASAIFRSAASLQRRRMVMASRGSGTFG